MFYIRTDLLIVLRPSSSRAQTGLKLPVSPQPPKYWHCLTQNRPVQASGLYSTSPQIPVQLMLRPQALEHSWKDIITCYIAAIGS